MEDVAGWVAPAATMIAAMMTAANLGARLTGWGFVVFTVGSIAWTTIGLAQGETNLIVANAFLTVVNLVGIWRWLGREVKYQKTSEVIAEESVDAPVQTLTPAGKLIGQTVRDARGDTLGNVVDAMIGCDDRRVQGLLVRSGGGVTGIGERIVLLDVKRFSLDTEGVLATVDADALARLPEAAAV